MSFKRIVTPGEMSGAVLFSAGERAGAISGQQLVVGGGLVMIRDGVVLADSSFATNSVLLLICCTQEG